MQLQPTRRSLLKSAGALTLGAWSAASLTGLQKAAANRLPVDEPAALTGLRAKAIRRKRRLIFNNDGGDIEHASTVDALMAQRNRPLLGSQVDSIFYGTGNTTMLTCLSQVAEVYSEFGGPWADNIAALKSAGDDTLAATVDFCREHRLEIFWTHRMNDVHCSSPDAEWLLCRWKREHPQYLMGTREDRDRSTGMNSPRYWWSALDYEQPEVLDYICRIQQDICNRYDIDGVECDYFRTPLLFRPNLDYQPVTTSQVEILTNFQRRLRKIHLQEGTRRGRPILTAARVPGTPEACRHVGIDIQRWLEEGLLDLLTVTGGYLPFTEPVDHIIKMAHQAKVPVYPSINTPLILRRPRQQLEALRGAASNMFHAGADGILLFNHFRPDFPATNAGQLMDIGSPETLVGKNKCFVIDSGRWEKGCYSQGISQSHVLPQAIPADGSPLVVQLPIGDDLAVASRSGSLASVVLQIQLSETTAAKSMEIRLNGQVLTAVENSSEPEWLGFHPRAKDLRLGSNEISVRIKEGLPGKKILADLQQVQLPVVYR